MFKRMRRESVRFFCFFIQAKRNLHAGRAIESRSWIPTFWETSPLTLNFATFVVILYHPYYKTGHGEKGHSNERWSLSRSGEPNMAETVQ